MNLIEKIENRSARIGIVGLGYVGLPLAIEFGNAGFKVKGFDIDFNKIELLKQGKSYIQHIPSEKIQNLMEGDRLTATANFDELMEIDCIIICLPTPLNKNREPDLSYVLNATKIVAEYLRLGQLVVLESTTYPGTTDEDMRQILEGTGFKAGKDFYLAYSPEREDPNNQKFSVTTIPKVVGGYTPQCLDVAISLYNTIVAETIPVSSTKVAEATKLLENIYRAVNIALVNELKMLFDKMGIDIWEVIQTAKTKPFGFQAFYPGPGLGGHCIPIDPFYLTWKAREYDFHTRFIELAGEINTYMPYYVMHKAIDALNDRGIAMKNAKILILGIAYKKDVSDTRESASLKLIELFMSKGAEQIDYHDPHVAKVNKTQTFNYFMESVEFSAEKLASYDCVVIATDHSTFNYESIVKNSRLVIDTRNSTDGLDDAKIVKA